MPCTMYVPMTPSRVCAAAISTQGCDGWTMVVHFRPSSISTRTSTSVIVSLQAGKLDALAGETFRPGVNPAPLDERVREFLYVGLSQVLHVVRKLQSTSEGACPRGPACARAR